MLDRSMTSGGGDLHGLQIVGRVDTEQRLIVSDPGSDDVDLRVVEDSELGRAAA